jgi:hypothetical protein
MLYCLIVWAKTFVPTFVCHHFQTIGGLTHESINWHGGFMALFCLSFFEDGAMLCIPLGPSVVEFIYMEVKT